MKYLEELFKRSSIKKMKTDRWLYIKGENEEQGEKIERDDSSKKKVVKLFFGKAPIFPKFLFFFNI